MQSSLTYGPIYPYEIASIQQMVQDTDASSMDFNHFSSSIFVARNSYNIGGFVYGCKGYGDCSEVLTIHGMYLQEHLDDHEHATELRVAFTNWAAQALNVTHYRLGESGQPIPIAIHHAMPPQSHNIHEQIADTTAILENALPQPVPAYL